MNSFEIKSLMKKIGVSQEQIVKKLGITRGYVNHVIHGKRSARRVRQAISDALGKPYEEVWGDGKDGNQIFSVPEEYKEKVKKIGLPSIHELATVSEKFKNNLRGILRLTLLWNMRI